MSVDVTKTGRRGYVTIDEVQQFADITVTDEAEAIDQISQAEELIDSWVGFQQKARPNIVKSEVKSATSNTLTEIDNLNVLFLSDDYYKGCEVEIIGGTGAGQIRKITGQLRATKTITVDRPWDTQPDSSSLFRIYQLGKFPRDCDLYMNSMGTHYYPTIPDAVKRATAAQVQYMITQRPEFFASDGLEKTKENIGNYGYEMGNGQSSQSARVRLTGPRVRQFLRGITNRVGSFE